MGNLNITRQKVLLAADSSNFTSSAYLVADYGTYQTLSWYTTEDSASTLTIQGTTVDGFDAAIAETDWSDLSTVVAPGQIAVDIGSRWLRVIAGDSTESLCSVVFNGKY